MDKRLNVLIIEDSDADTQLMLRALARAGYAVSHQQIQDAPALTQAVRQQSWDVVLCDYRLPQLNGHTALEILRNASLDVPFILVSGVLAENEGLALISAGARDFVSKSSIARLAPTVEREIEHARSRRAHGLAVHARKKNEERFRAIIESSPVPLAVNDAQGNITYLNPKFIQTFGYTIHDIPTLTDWWPRAYPDAEYRDWVMSTWAKAVHKALQEGTEVEPMELNIVCKDGTERTILAHPAPMDDSHLVYLYDITASKKVEADLRNERLRLTAILNSAVDAIILIDSHGTILSFNPAAETIFRYAAQEVIGKNVRILMPGNDSQQHDSYIQRYVETGEGRIIGKGREVVGLRRTGEQFPMDLSLASWTDGNNRYFTGIVRDITQQNAVNAQLMQTQKMESLTHLSGGLAHDFNNLLGIIIGNLDLLEGRLNGDEKSLRNVQTALRSALRGADITRRMLTFARLQHGQADSDQAQDINSLTEEIVAILRRTLGPQYGIHTALLPNLPPVKLDPSEFENVLLNLALNARDAMSDGGQIVILTRHVTREDLALPSLLALDDAPSYVLLEFSDTGHGMSEEVKARALDPFFTTKTAKGTGLGLAMAYSFAKERKGHIQIFSDPGVGTAIHLYLPATERAPPNAVACSDGSDTRDMPRGTETVLIVDDEPDLLALTTTHLQSLGYNVFSASNGLDALSVLQNNPAIDLLLTDVVMPGGLLGTELAARAQQLRPNLPVILCSGFPMKVRSDAQYAQFSGSILSKPYRKAELAHAVRQKLDTQSP